MDRKLQIAFVCTGNTGRSVIAAALATAAIEKGGLPLAVISRAVDMNPFDTAPETHAVTLLADQGIDIAAHRAAPLTANDIRHADLVITMTAQHRDAVAALYPADVTKIALLAAYANRDEVDVADAHGKAMDFYRQVFAQISAYVPVVLSKALQERGSHP